LTLQLTLQLTLAGMYENIAFSENHISLD